MLDQVAWCQYPHSILMITMENNFLIALLCSALLGCGNDPQPTAVTSAPASKVQDTSSVQTAPKLNASRDLVNNPTPIPQGYVVDTTYLKQPLQIDFNGDKKLDAFRVLKNPQKSGMQYLFEFRIADSQHVYWYENDEEGYDLDTFGSFDSAKVGEQFVDVMKLEDADLVSFEDAPKKAQLILKHEGVVVNLREETCGSSLFYLDNEKLQRVFLC